MKNLNVRATDKEYIRLVKAKNKYEIETGNYTRSWIHFFLHLIAKRRVKK